MSKGSSLRIAAVRAAFGDGLVILTDANTGYDVADARAAMPRFDALGVGWLEEPFPAHDARSYQMATTFGGTPLAAGENHYTRFEFQRVIEDRAITILQPDLSKTGGFTEALRIDAKGCVRPPDAPGIGVEVDMDFLAAHPLIDGPAYV